VNRGARDRSVFGERHSCRSLHSRTSPCRVPA
jgi:hypothetical protein